MTLQRQERYVARLAAAMVCALGFLAAPAGSPQQAQAATTERVVIDRHTGLAIAGFDPVAYFTDQEPLQGDAQFEASVSGAVWRFCSDANRAFFTARPDIYAPQFGGYDPVGVARGVPLQGSALVWAVSGQRLYLFWREENRDAFVADPQRYLHEAALHWPALRATLAQ
jgi:YHS domain-containing protein